ncbi:ABC transporter substrate-binding protein [Chelatococcus reniformis]|uniref:ABC transporter substrate-binding protein n=1 Tax=Chelatococcus reniformis TaxID=1494448 RepID=A0A916TZM5_9HYPH|nr:ABC transporter substrate-binding protein [Chelatococcus reniformis]GGC54154.1 ABC transporter substrate-binding protein [Chelatococcus reniformis]
MRGSGRVGWGAALAAMLLASGQASAGPASTPEEIRIGVLTDMVSAYADLVGPGSVIAAQMAIEDFEAQDKPSFKIRLYSADHQNKPDIASNIARRWFDEDKIDMVTDVTGASAALAVSKLAPIYNKVILMTSSGQPSLTSEDCQPTVLHWTYNTYAIGRSTAEIVTRAGKDTWFFVTADYAGGRSMQDGATAGVLAGGGRVIGAAKHPPASGTDFSSQLLTAQASGAKVIGIANAGADAVNTIKQAHEFGMSKTQTLAAALLFITDIYSLGLPVAQGMYLTSAFDWDLNEASRAWSRRFFARHGKMPTMVQAGLYSATLHYLKAVKAAKTAEAKAVVAAMKAAPVQDMFTPNGRIREDGLMVHDLYVFRVKTPAESREPWDLLKLEATIPGDKAFAPLSESKCPHVSTR